MINGLSFTIRTIQCDIAEYTLQMVHIGDVFRTMGDAHGYYY